MPTVRLSDIYNPLTFSRRAQEAQIRLNAFIASGIAIQDPSIQTQISAGGNIGDVNFYGPLGLSEPRYSNDDPSDVNATHQKVSNKLQKWRSAQRNQSWQVMDLARELADQEPVDAITNRIGHYWAHDDEERLIQSMLGVLADNEANDSSDMVVTKGNDSASAIVDAERISGDAVIEAMQTLGDHKDSVNALAIHSQVHARLQKQNLIVYQTTSDGNISFPTYLGKRLIIDDSLPAVMGTNRIMYTCILFGAGSVLTASGKVANPSELYRNPNSGNGGGDDTIFSRISNVMHPNGFSFISGSVAGQSATRTELASAANWDRIADRKNIPLAFLKVND